MLILPQPCFLHVPKTRGILGKEGDHRIWYLSLSLMEILIRNVLDLLSGIYGESLVKLVGPPEDEIDL